MLYTNLVHLETAADYAAFISQNENVIIICGRIDMASITTYKIVEELKKHFPKVKFCDMEYDNPESTFVRKHIVEEGFKEIPFVLYYKGGKLSRITSGVQNKEQLNDMLDKTYCINV